MDPKLAKELRQIRNLLILIAVKLGGSPDQVGKVTGMGANNISTLVPNRKNRTLRKAKRTRR
jgi:hypothetical protein